MVTHVGSDDGRDPAVLHTQRPDIHDFAADAHAAITKDATRPVKVNDWRPLLFVAMRLAAGLARLAWISAHSKPLLEEDWIRSVLAISKDLKITRAVTVLQCGSRVAMPVTWGIFRPLIVLPAGAPEWFEKRKRIVLSHELAHVARGDWFLQICAEIARGFYWFHPLAWIATRRLRQESECACDDFVLNSGIEPSDYANQLLDLARTLRNPGGAWSPALAFARPSNLERRFAAMLNLATNRCSLSPRAELLAALSALCLLLPLAALQLSAQNLSGQFTGTIYDPSGAAVPNATVIHDQQQGQPNRDDDVRRRREFQIRSIDYWRV